MGIGAKWEVTEVVDQMGMRLTQTMTFELVSLDGNRAGMHVAVAQTAPPQSVSPPGFPEESKMRLTRFHGQGEWDLELDLTEIVPRSYSIEILLEVTAEVESAKESGTLEMRIETESRMESR